jgi:hypothetical protein
MLGNWLFVQHQRGANGSGAHGQDEVVKASFLLNMRGHIGTRSTLLVEDVATFFRASHGLVMKVELQLGDYKYELCLGRGHEGSSCSH